MDAKVVAEVRRKYELLAPEMNERSRRQWAASEACELGYSIEQIAEECGFPNRYYFNRSVTMPFAPLTNSVCSCRSRTAQRVGKDAQGRRYCKR